MLNSVPLVFLLNRNIVLNECVRLFVFFPFNNVLLVKRHLFI